MSFMCLCSDKQKWRWIVAVVQWQPRGRVQLQTGGKLGETLEHALDEQTRVFLRCRVGFGQLLVKIEMKVLSDIGTSNEGMQSLWKIGDAFSQPDTAINPTKVDF